MTDEALASADERKITIELNRLVRGLSGPSERLSDPSHPEYEYSRRVFDAGVAQIDRLVARLMALGARATPE